jgi:hypothetical protein
MKILSASAHGVLDYVTVILFALAPTLFGLTGWRRRSPTCWRRCTCSSP